MKSGKLIWSAVLVALAAVQSAGAAQTTWNNTGTDFNTAGNWGSGVPGAGDVARFAVERTTNPNLSASLSIAGLFFSGGATGNYDITNSGGATFTLTGISTTGESPIDNASAAAIRSEVNGTGTFDTNAIDVPITLAPASGTVSTFYQAPGGRLRVGGNIAGTGITLNLTGGGRFELDGTNTYSGGTTIDTAGTILILTNNNALGTGALSINAITTISGGNVQIPNAVIMSADTTTIGTDTLFLTGAVTNSGGDRTLTQANTDVVVLTSVLNLSESNLNSRTFTINGSQAIAIDALIRNNSGANTVGSNLTYSGTSTLTLMQGSTYSGTTTLSSGNVVVGHGAAFGTSTLVLNNLSTFSASTNLTGANAIANNVTLSGNQTFTGDENLELSGTVTQTASRTITNSMTGGAGLTLSGTINLSNTASNFVMTITGTGNTTISGVIANGGTATASQLTKTGTGTLTLNVANTFSGGVTINNGTLVASADGALGTGNVSLAATTVTLTLQSGAVNNYISDSASISIVTDAIADLDFTGASDLVSDIVLAGASQATLGNFGTYGAVGSGANFESAFFTGDGTLELIPEASTWAMLGVGTVLLGGAQWLRRRRS